MPTHCLRLYAFPEALTIPRTVPISRNALGESDAHTLALSALGWILGDEARANRLLTLTGLSPDELRHRLTDPGLLGAVLDFLMRFEPDLLACAAALKIDPQTLVSASQTLNRDEYFDPLSEN